MLFACQNPECEFPANPDPQISLGFCCEKCEGRFNGEEWGSAGKRHTAYCTSKCDPSEYNSGNGGGLNSGFESYGPARSLPGGRGKCAHPECEYTANSDPSISLGYCCEKCEGLHQGADWAEGGKRHYKNCEKIEFTGASGWAMAGPYGKGAARKGAVSWGLPIPCAGKGWGKGPMGPQGFGGPQMYQTKGFGGPKGFQEKGFGGFGGSPGFQAKGLSKGKSKGPSLSDHPAENKVWVGNLVEGVELEDLTTYFALTGGTVAFAAIMKGNSAGVAYASAEEAAEAISLLNGSDYGGAEIVVDAWTGK